MSELVRIGLSEEAVDAIADRVLARLAPVLESGNAADRWMSAVDASEYLGISVNALYKHTSAGEIPCASRAAGGKLWFKRADLDAWRRR